MTGNPVIDELLAAVEKLKFELSSIHKSQDHVREAAVRLAHSPEAHRQNLC